MENLNFSRYHINKLLKITTMIFTVISAICIIIGFAIDKSNKLFSALTLGYIVFILSGTMSAAVVMAVLVDDLLILRNIRIMNCEKYNSWKKFKHKFLIILFAVLSIADIYLYINECTITNAMITGSLIMAIISLLTVAKFNENTIRDILSERNAENENDC